MTGGRHAYASRTELSAAAGVCLLHAACWDDRSGTAVHDIPLQQTDECLSGDGACVPSRLLELSWAAAISSLCLCVVMMTIEVFALQLHS